MNAVRSIGLTLGYLIATVVMTGPLLNYSQLATASYPGDARLIIWTLAWDNHASLNGLPLFESNIYHPAANSLSYNDHLFGISLFTLPIYAATKNPVLAYNLVWLLSFLLSGLAMHALLVRYVRSDLGAFAGSLVFTFSFYKMLHGHGHLQQVWTWLIPVSVLCLERWRERPTITRALIWALAVVLQALSSWYLAVIVGVVQAVVLVAVMLARVRERSARPLWQLVAAAALAIAVIWPFARHYRALAPTDVREASLSLSRPRRLPGAAGEHLDRQSVDRPRRVRSALDLGGADPVSRLDRPGARCNRGLRRRAPASVASWRCLWRAPADGILAFTRSVAAAGQRVDALRGLVRAAGGELFSRARPLRTGAAVCAVRFRGLRRAADGRRGSVRPRHPGGAVAADAERVLRGPVSERQAAAI